MLKYTGRYILKVNPVAVRPYMDNKNHECSFQITGTTVSWVLPQYDDGSYVNIFSSEEERKELEAKLHISLDTNDPNNALINERIRLSKLSEDLDDLKLILDLTDNPKHYLWFLILKVQPDIVYGWENRNVNGRLSRFVLMKEEEQVNETKVRSKKKTEVYAWLNKNENDKMNLLDGLKLADQLVRNTLNVTELYDRYVTVLENNNYNVIDKLYDIVVLKDEDYKHKLFTLYAVESGFLVRRGSNYYTQETSELIGTKDDIISFFKQPQNAELKTAALAKISSYKSTINK